jgi:hypothetical protein
MAAVLQRQCLPRTSGSVGRMGSTAAQPNTPPPRTAPRPTPIRYRIVEDDDSSQRVSAVDDNDQLIVGAFRPAQNNYWLLYITPLVAAAAGVPFRPDHLPLWSRAQARRWTDLVARLYCCATQFSRAAQDSSSSQPQPDEPLHGAPTPDSTTPGQQ